MKLSADTSVDISRYVAILVLALASVVFFLLFVVGPRLSFG